MDHLIILALFFILNFTLFGLNNLISQKMNLFDFPDFKRKIHSKKIPVTGGLYLYINIIFFLIIIYINNNDFQKFLFSGNRELLSFIFLISSLFFIGLYDDKYNLKPLIKLSLSTLSILICVILNNNLVLEVLVFSSFSYELDLSNMSIFFSVLCIIIFLNALNMFDGIDSQVSTYSALFLFYLMIKFNILMILFLFPVIFFCIFYNFQKKIFLGDSGTNIFAGLIAFFLIKFYNSSNNITCDQIFLLMMIPGLDMIRLFIVRILNGKNPLFADNNHIHHLYLRKFSLKLTFLLLQLQISLPIILYHIFNINLLYLILLSSLIYFFNVIYFSKIKNNKVY